MQKQDQPAWIRLFVPAAGAASAGVLLDPGLLYELWLHATEAFCTSGGVRRRLRGSEPVQEPVFSSLQLSGMPKVFILILISPNPATTNH
jgi:hypothetical protein